VLIEDGGWLLEASVYVHLNCVATAALGWGKREKRAQGKGVARPPTAAQVEGRLEKLRKYPWSTYRGYAGYGKLPGWVEARLLWRRAQKKDREGCAGYRELVEDRIRQGVPEGLGAQVRWGLVLGGERFARKVRRHLKVGRESRGRLDLNRWMRFEEIVRVVERIKKAPWAEFRDRHGDPGRDVALWAGRRFGGMALKELGDRAGGMDYGAVAVAIIRLAKKAQKDGVLRRLMRAVEHKCQI
jgi:GNAT superfamily N-acetyltransferase